MENSGLQTYKKSIAMAGETVEPLGEFMSQDPKI